jgi:hypothetical protein
MSSHGAYKSSVLPIPYPNSLIVGRRDDPRQLVVEEDSSNVIEMAGEGKKATLGVVIPNFDTVIITTRHKHGLCLVKVYTTDWSIVFFKSVQQGSHSIVPHLDCAAVERHQKPWSLGVEGYSLGPRALGLELLKELVSLSFGASVSPPTPAAEKEMENITNLGQHAGSGSRGSHVGKRSSNRKKKKKKNKGGSL